MGGDSDGRSPRAVGPARSTLVVNRRSLPDGAICSCGDRIRVTAVANMLVELAANAELFHTATETSYADLAVDGHRETWPVRSPRFRAWLRRRYYEAIGDALGP